MRFFVLFACIICSFIFFLQHEVNGEDTPVCNIDLAKVQTAIKSPLQWSKGYSEPVLWKLFSKVTIPPKKKFQTELRSPLNSSITLYGGFLQTQYTFVEFHFHWGDTNNRGSEHTINGKSYPMVADLVHEQKGNPNQQKLAVLSFFFKISKDDNPVIEKLLPAMMKALVTHQSEEVEESFAISDLFPERSFLYFYYNGSLASNYTEPTVWMVFLNPLSVSQSQLNVLRDMATIDNVYKNNYECPRRLTDSVPVYFVV